MNLMTVNKLSLHMTINTIQQLSQLTSTTINTSTYRYKTGDTCIQKLYKVIDDFIYRYYVSLLHRQGVKIVSQPVCTKYCIARNL